MTVSELNSRMRYCPNTFSLPCLHLLWKEERSAVNSLSCWWKEQLLGHCLCRGWRSLHCPGSPLYNCTLDQAKVCLWSPFVFMRIEANMSRKLGDHTYLSWNNDSPSTAMSTGRDMRPGGA